MPNERSSVKRSIRPSNLIVLLGAPSAAGSVVALFGGLHWEAELFTHFRVQYFCVLLFCALYLAIARRFQWAAIYGVAAVVNLAVILPLYFGKSPDAGQPRELRVMLMNVNLRTGDSVRVIEAIERFEPDVVLLQEVDNAWLGRLASVYKDYPFRIEHPRSDNFGIALLSRLPLRDGRIAYFGDSWVPSAVVRLELGTQSISFIATHPPPPAGAEYSRMRDTQLEAVADAVLEMPKPVIVLGDLNMTPWSPAFHRFLRQAKLTDSGQGWGVQPTWPVNLIPFRIPLDHCFHSGGLRVVRREIGPNVGSDHYPLIVDFALDKPINRRARLGRGDAGRSGAPWPKLCP